MSLDQDFLLFGIRVDGLDFFSMENHLTSWTSLRKGDKLADGSLMQYLYCLSEEQGFVLLRVNIVLGVLI